VTQQHFGQRLQFLARVRNARRVAWAVEGDELRTRRDRRFQLLGADLVARGYARVDDDRNAARDLDHVRVGHPVGRGDHDFIARVEDSLAEIEVALLAAAGDEDLVRGVGKIIVAMELGDDGALQRRRTVHRRVLGLAALDGVFGSLLDVFRGVEIRFAGAKADDVLAARAQFRGALRDGKRGRGLEAADT